MLAIGRFDTHVTRHDVPVSEGNTFNTYFSIKTNATMRLDLVRFFFVAQFYADVWGANPQF